MGADRELMLEWVDGETLEVCPRFSLGVATQLFREIVAGTAAINRAGFLHSDLHPKNIMVRAGHAAILDLGLAYPVSGTDLFTTCGGTGGYRAPERCREMPAGIPADVYSLGCVLYYLVQFRHAFRQDGDRGRVYNKEMPPMISGAPAWVNEVIQKATQHHPADRFRTAEDMIAALPAQ